ncbi:MAG: hypothetical protein AAF399_14035 [Bacteroidota bacterium]
MNHFIRPSLLFALSILLLSLASAQKNSSISVPLTEDAWLTRDGQVEFFDYKSTRAVKSANDGYFNLLLKEQEFSTGTIEFDVELSGNGFPGINFHIGPDTVNSEVYYLRHFGKPDPLRRTTMQYAAVLDGVNLWDITDDYQAAAALQEGEWNHVKLVISENQLRAYVNDMDEPALHVPALEGIHKNGGISLSGNVIYANLVLHPGQTEDLPDVAGYDPTSNDPQYLRNWEVSEPLDFPFGRDLLMGIPYNPGVAIDTTFLNESTTWKPMQADRRALVNLTARYGATPDGQRRVVWLKTTVESATAQEKLLRLGFRDEVWVFINGLPLHVDKNYYGAPGMKDPIGRCSLANAAFDVPLQEGKNELLIGLTNYFYGWGLLARWEENGGLSY